MIRLACLLFGLGLNAAVVCELIGALLCLLIVLFCWFTFATHLLLVLFLD